MRSYEYSQTELDIVDSLRNHARDRDTDAWMNCEDAADEIEKLRNEVEELRAMNEDPIKLREALYAAEPFLTYLFKEATADRNSKHLEDALNKVRGALGMPTVTKAKRSLEVDLEANASDVRIELVRLTENEDGSAIATFDLNQDAVKLLTKVGLLKLLTDAAAAYAEQDDAESKA